MNASFGQTMTNWEQTKRLRYKVWVDDAVSCTLRYNNNSNSNVTTVYTNTIALVLFIYFKKKEGHMVSCFRPQNRLVNDCLTNGSTRGRSIAYCGCTHGLVVSRIISSGKIGGAVVVHILFHDVGVV